MHKPRRRMKITLPRNYSRSFTSIGQAETALREWIPRKFVLVRIIGQKTSGPKTRYTIMIKKRLRR